MNQSSGMLLPPPLGETSASAPERLWFFDNLKALLCLCVVAYHSVMVICPLDKAWPFLEPMVKALLGAFIFISAYFEPASLARKGPWLYGWDRLVRLGLPTLAWLGILFVLLHEINYLHMWFTADLLLFNLLYAGWRILRPAPPVLSLRPPPSDLALLGFLAVVGIVTALVRLKFRMGDWDLVFGFFPMPMARMSQLLAFFLFGLWAARTDWVRRCPPAQAQRWLALGVGGVVLCAAYVLCFGEHTGWLSRGGFSVPGFVNASLETLLSFALCFGVIMAFRDRLNREFPVWRSLAQNSYGIFFLHMAPVLKMRDLLAPTALSPTLQCLLTFGISVLASWAMSEFLLCRLPGLRKIFAAAGRA